MEEGRVVEEGLKGCALPHTHLIPAPHNVARATRGLHNELVLVQLLQHLPNDLSNALRAAGGIKWEVLCVCGCTGWKAVSIVCMPRAKGETKVQGKRVKRGKPTCKAFKSSSDFKNNFFSALRFSRRVATRASCCRVCFSARTYFDIALERSSAMANVEGVVST